MRSSDRSCYDAAVDCQGTHDQKDIAYSARFLEHLNQLNPSDAQRERLIYGAANACYKELLHELTAQDMSKKLARKTASAIREKLLDRCFSPPPTSTQPTQDLVEQPSTRQAFETSGSASAQTQQPQPLPKKPGWAGVFKRPGVLKKHGSSSKKRMSADEEADLLGIVDNVKHSFRTPAKEIAGLGTIFIGLGGILVLSFAIWTAQDLCRPKSPQHDDQGCRVAIAAAVGASLIAVGGVLTGAALTCYDRGRASLTKRKYKRAMRNEERVNDVPTSQPA